LSKSELPGITNKNEPDIVLDVEFASRYAGQAVKLLTEPSGGGRAAPDPVVLKAVARARSWFEQLAAGKAQSMAEIAELENITDNYVGNLIHLAWLPPRQVDLILLGDASATKAVRKSMVSRSVHVIWSKQD
jgi:site-specific DNA recombinase